MEYADKGATWNTTGRRDVRERMQGSPAVVLTSSEGRPGQGVRVHHTFVQGSNVVHLLQFLGIWAQEVS